MIFRICQPLRLVRLLLPIVKTTDTAKQSFTTAHNRRTAEKLLKSIGHVHRGEGGRNAEPSNVANVGRAVRPDGPGAQTRRCSWRRRNLRSAPTSTSRSLRRVAAGFQLSISGRIWVSTEGRQVDAHEPGDDRFLDSVRPVSEINAGIATSREAFEREAEPLLQQIATEQLEIVR